MISRIERKRLTRDALLDAARLVIARQGFASTTARDIAAEAGVAIGTVFVHFPTMAALAETLLDETVQQALTKAGQDQPDSLVERFVHVASVLYDAYDATPELSRDVIAGSLFQSSPGSPSELRMREFRGWVTEEITAAVADGQIPPIDPGEAFLGYFALYFGVLVAGLRGELDRPTQLVMLRSALHRLLDPEQE
jgi:AcrR family transcriptional regulator